MRISDWSFRRVLFRSAWSTDRGVPIVAGITEALRASCITFPAPSVIERAGIAGRARARQRAYAALLAGVPVASLHKLAAVLIVEPRTGMTPPAALRVRVPSPPLGAPTLRGRGGID